MRPKACGYNTQVAAEADLFHFAENNFNIIFCKFNLKVLFSCLKY